jgi:hypothetical protein
MTLPITLKKPFEWFWKETIKYFTNIKVYVICLIWSLVIKTVFRIFLAPLVGPKYVK